jgi:hypothetical protein
MNIDHLVLVLASALLGFCLSCLGIVAFGGEEMLRGLFEALLT